MHAQPLGNCLDTIELPPLVVVQDYINIFILPLYLMESKDHLDYDLDYDRSGIKRVVGKRVMVT